MRSSSRIFVDACSMMMLGVVKTMLSAVFVPACFRLCLNLSGCLAEFVFVFVPKMPPCVFSNLIFRNKWLWADGDWKAWHPRIRNIDGVSRECSRSVHMNNIIPRCCRFTIFMFDAKIVRLDLMIRFGNDLNCKESFIFIFFRIIETIVLFRKILLSFPECFDYTREIKEQRRERTRR